MAVNIWTPQGQLAGLTARCNPNVIYEGNPQVLGGPNVFKMWCGVNNGTTGIWYYESANGLTSWTGAAGNPIVTGTGRSFPTVYHIGSTYYLYTNAFPSATAITVQTSSDGITWGSATAGVANTQRTWETGGARTNLVPAFCQIWNKYRKAPLHATMRSQTAEYRSATRPNPTNWRRRSPFTVALFR
jgi:hypothetical protein